jgi:hypothetical protein
VEGILQAIGLWWERLHIFTDDVVQHSGVVSRWKLDFRPAGETEVQPGELVELHVTIPPDLALPDANPPLRFDILEFDWLFFSGTDDPLESLRTPGAADPVGDFTVLERTLVERPYSATETTLDAVVTGYRASQPADFETRVLVVRDTRNGWKDVIAWWRVPVVDDREPRAYFVAELPGPDPEHNVRDASSIQLHVARAAVPGAGVRLHGTITDSVVAAGENAQPVPAATLALGERTTTSATDGRYVLDARLGVGDTPLTVARPGIEPRTLTVRLTQRGDGGTDVAVLDEQDTQVAAAVIAAGADPALATLQLDLTTLVHRISGTVVWPDTRIIPPAPQAPHPAMTLAGRRVCALKLEAGAMRAQIPSTSKQWDRLRSRPDVLRSARPGRPARGEATAANGQFELSFFDLQEGAQYLMWVEGADPRDASRQVPDAIVRTIPTPGMRRESGQPIPGTNPPMHTFAPVTVDRRVIVASGFLRRGVEAALDVLKVVDTAPDGSPPVLRLLRGRPANPDGIDAVPPADVDERPIDVATRRATALTLEVMPLVPIFEAAPDRSPVAARGRAELHDQLDARHRRGYLSTGVRWVLDARRGPRAVWDDAAACTVLECTLFTHPSLTSARIHNPNWGWWRADAVSAADFARIDQQANAVFANRRLAEEFVPVLAGPVPRLLGLFERRHLHVSPGHGVFASPAASRNYRTDRGGWVGYGPAIENWGGESENSVGIGAHLRRIAALNRIRVTVSRETDPTVPGLEQRAGGVFAPVDPAVPANHAHPRLWQQSAYYWLAAVYDAAPGPLGPLVLGNPANNTYAEGINRRVTLFEHQASDPNQPVDVFVALHTNASAANVRGFLALYLDVRPLPNDPAPDHPDYAEHNLEAQAFAGRLTADIAAEVEFRNRGVVSYFANGNPVRELAYTLTHHRNGSAVQGIRANANPGNVLPQHIVFPTPGGRTIPVGYVEFGFHSNADDAAALAQSWCRLALAIGVARACEWQLRRRADPLTGFDVIALLRAMFGSIPAVEGLSGGAAPLGAGAVTAAAVATAITTATGRALAVAAPTLDAVVTAVETARDAVARRDLVRQIATALAPKAGYDAADLDVDVANPLPAPTDAAQAERRRAVADAVVRPLLVALGASIAEDAAPVMADLPRSDRPPTRGDAAAVLAAGLGIRPAELAAVTRPINGVTVLAAAGPADDPDSHLPTSAIDAAALAIGGRPAAGGQPAVAGLRPVDIYRLLRVRATDGRGADLVGPLVSGDDLYLTVETGGTPWRVQPSDITFELSRAGGSDVELACAVRRVDALITEPWQVPEAEGAAEFSLSATIDHPDAGEQTLEPVRFTITVAAAR